MLISRWRIGYARLDYVRDVHWAQHTEDHGDAVVLELETADGLRGAAEAIMRAKWHGMTPHEVEVALSRDILPALMKVDCSDDAALAKVFAAHKASGFTCALADQALWDLRVSKTGKPLWQLLDAPAPHVRVSFTLTRTRPHIMAREAEEARARYGFTAFKVKTGQGIEIDRDAIREIRAAVGNDTLIMADSNRAHGAEEVAAMSRMLADAGVAWFEDPCAFTSDNSFVEAQANSVLPILVDNQSRSLEAASVFLDLGARALSVKTMKTGISESREVAVLAARRNAKVAVGISASGGAGAIHTLSLAASLPPDLVCLPCEETFFIYLKRDLIEEPLQVKGGFVDIGGRVSVSSQIDWRRMDRVVD